MNTIFNNDLNINKEKEKAMEYLCSDISGERIVLDSAKKLNDALKCGLNPSLLTEEEKFIYTCVYGLKSLDKYK